VRRAGTQQERSAGFVNLAALIAVALLAACSGVDGPRWADASESDAAVVFASPRRQFVVQADPTIGAIEFNGVMRDRAPHRVIADRPGQVIEVLVASGETVTAAHPILIFLPDPSEAERIDLEIARLRIERALAASADDEQLAQAQAEFDQLAASFDSRTELIVAGQPGIVTGTRSNVQYRVPGGAPMFEVADPDDLVLEVVASGDDLEWLTNASRVVARVDDQEFSGQVHQILDADDATTRSRIHIVLDRSEALSLGDRLEVAVPVDTNESAIWVPLDAIGRSGGSSYVLIADAQNQLQRLDVALGRRSETHVLVRSGVHVGMTLVAP